MDNYDLLKLTTKGSLLVQFVGIIISLYGLTIHLAKKHMILIDILTIESIVQIIEFSFYFYFVYAQIPHDMAVIRYYDWFLTTPTMLFTMVMYFEYLKNINNQSEKITNIKEIWENDYNRILKIGFYNFLMLLVGYLGELQIVSKLFATIFGFGNLGLSFYEIYDGYARFSTEGTNLFILLSGIWGSYGIAYLFPETEKNITYNGLDLISKNFFGIYLAWKIFSIRND